MSTITLSRQLKNLPKAPGVYLFFGKRGEVIYVGKAVNLSSRVNSYFIVEKEGGGKQARVRPASSFGIKTTKMIDEVRRVETILVKSELEALLLEARLIKENQPRYNVVAKDDKRPLYIQIRRADEFPQVTIARYKSEKGAVYFGPFPAAGIVRQVLRRLRRVCPFHQGRVGKRKCFYSHLALCEPCPAQIVKISDSLERGRKKCEYRRQIWQLVRILEGKNKRVEEELTRLMKRAAEAEEFEMAARYRDRLAQLQYITSFYTPTTSYLENPNLVEDERARETELLFELLKRPLKLRRAPKRIEGFDSSHIRGKQAAVSMVTFVDGVAEKSLYRRFKIRLSKTGDDLAMLKEALMRRLAREEWGLPDVMLVDGGAGQVGMAAKVMRESGKRIPVIGLAKRFETVVIARKEGFLQMRPRVGNAALRLLMRVRDESHRFAQNYHHNLRKKALLSRG